MKTKIYALPGFLGLPSDWDIIGEGIGEPWEAVELFSLSHPKYGLQCWGRALNHYVAQQSVSRRILMGYSQGGRLGMHALIDAPELWAGAIMVSAHTGLILEKERSSRLRSDERWAQRFLKDPWEVLINDWNCQTVFRIGALPPQRKERDYVRSDLACAIQSWSIGRQGNLRGALSQLTLPLLWIAGEKDFKYVALSQQIAVDHFYSLFWIAPEVGHRVPWESPQLFSKKVKLWLQRTEAFPCSQNCYLEKIGGNFSGNSRCSLI